MWRKTHTKAGRTGAKRRLAERKRRERRGDSSVDDATDHIRMKRSGRGGAPAPGSTDETDSARRDDDGRGEE